MKVLKFSFLFYSIWLIVGITCADYLEVSLTLGVLLICVIFLLLLTCTRLLRFMQTSKFSFYSIASALITICFCLGALSVQLYKYKLGSFSSDDFAHTLVVEVTKKVASTSSKSRYIVDLYSIDDSKEKGQLLLYMPSDSIQVGDVIAFNGTVRAFDTIKNIGQFDYLKYNQNLGIEHQTYGYDYKLLYHNTTVLSVINSWREHLLSTIYSSESLSVEARAFVSALLLGDRSRMDQEIQNSFKNLGVIHVLAISGLHIGILYMFLEFIFRLFPRKFKAFCILICLWVFVFLSGFSPSVFRAVLMLSMFTVARSLRRNTTTLHIVSLSLFLSLLIKPLWLYDVGFQLSYSAVFGLVLFMPLFKNSYSTFWIVRYIQGLVFVSLVAQLSVLPFQLYYFGQFPVFFLVANIVIIPLITLFLLFSISWIIVVFFSTVLSGWIGYLITMICKLILLFIGFLSSFKWGESLPITVTLSEVIVLGICLYLLVQCCCYRRIVAFLALLLSCMSLQLLFLKQRENLYHTNEFIIPYGYKSSIHVYNRVGPNVCLFGDIEGRNATTLQDYCKTLGSVELSKKENQSLYFLGKYTCMVLSPNFDYYEIQLNKPITHIVFSGAVKVNYDRVLQSLAPREVIIYNDVPFYIKQMIVQSCIKNRIPYYDISNKGFYRLFYEL